MRRKKSKLDRNICGPQSFEIVILSAALTHCRCHPRSSIIAGGGATRFVNPPQHLSTGQSKWRSDEEEEEERTHLDILGKIHYEMNPLNTRRYSYIEILARSFHCLVSNYRRSTTQGVGRLLLWRPGAAVHFSHF